MMSKIFYTETTGRDIHDKLYEIELGTPQVGIVRLIVVDGDSDAVALELAPENMEALLVWLLEAIQAGEDNNDAILPK